MRSNIDLQNDSFFRLLSKAIGIFMSITNQSKLSFSALDLINTIKIKGFHTFMIHSCATL